VASGASPVAKTLAKLTISVAAIATAMWFGTSSSRLMKSVRERRRFPPPWSQRHFA
jgi:hypothetical protein